MLELPKAMVAVRIGLQALPSGEREKHARWSRGDNLSKPLQDKGLRNFFLWNVDLYSKKKKRTGGIFFRFYKSVS